MQSVSRNKKGINTTLVVIETKKLSEAFTYGSKTVITVKLFCRFKKITD